MVWDISSKFNIVLSYRGRQFSRYSVVIFIFAAFLFFLVFSAFSSAWSEEIFMTKKDFITEAFKGGSSEKLSLIFKGEVKEVSKKIMGHKYRKVRFRYWKNNTRTAWILKRIGKVMPITAGFIVENCKIASVHVLVYRESHGWEIKYPFFRDQFGGMFLVEGYKLNRQVDGITGATLSVNSMKKMTELALALHSLVPEIDCP